MSIYSRRRDIFKCDPPKIVFYGHSYVTRLFRWKNDYVSDTCPKVWDRPLLDSARYVYSGGSVWKNVHDRVQGIGVPQNQTQGDTWQALLDDINKGYVPTHIFSMCGANDVDTANDLYHYRMLNSQYYPFPISNKYGPSPRFFNNHSYRFPQYAIFDPDAFVEVKLYEICQHIDRVFCTLREHIGDVEVYAMGIPLRCYWYPHMVDLAEKLNQYLESKHKVTVVRINYLLTGQHFVRDGIHLNNQGYQLFMDRCLGCLIDPYYKIERKRKADRLLELSKIAKRNICRKRKCQSVQ